MMRKTGVALHLLTLFAMVFTLGLALPAGAQQDGPALTVGEELTQEEIVAGFQSDPASWLDLLRTFGLVVFTTPFNVADGLGDGPFNELELPVVLSGHRPTLQGEDVLFLRVNGLDSQSCNECHNIVTHATIPPTLGIGGVGGIAQNAMPLATLLDIADTFDNRVQYYPGHLPDLPMDRDGIADFNGRFINAPFLYGGGGVELVAKEMTGDLQAILDQALATPEPGIVFSLDTHGTNFGSIITLGGLGNVQLKLDGIGFLPLPSPVEPPPIDRVDLVVHPFGRKGDAFSMRDFDRGAMQFHFGIQPVEIPTIGHTDEDNDGVIDEITIEQMTFLHIFDVTNPRPYMEPLDPDTVIGQQKFHDVGCADCHHPEVVTDSPYLPLAQPENPIDPWQDVYLQIDLRDFGYDPAPNGGVKVPMYSDLKRHYMGEGLKETCERHVPQVCRVPNGDFITARLWGIADTAPYMHDGRATTLWDAIQDHDGDAAKAKEKFNQLLQIDQIRVINFLRKLRTPENPNQDILP